MKKVVVGCLVVGVCGLMSIANAGVTRFEFSRQLQESQCNQCYSQEGSLSVDEWRVVATSPLYGLEDIEYQGNEYYACVEQTVVDDLMQGYPRATSPFCAGKFCGSANTIAIDAAEAVLVLLREQVAANEEIPLSEIQETQKNQPFLSVEQLGILQGLQRRCETRRCVVESSQELTLLIRWRSQSTVSAPYADTNWGRTQVFLRRIGVDRSGVSSLQALSQTQIDDLLSPIQSTFECSKSDIDTQGIDTDQDGIVDSSDVCPRNYDPLQYDQDGDNNGDVCDNDIDGDGLENSLGVVDFQGRINQQKLLTSNDKTPGGLSGSESDGGRISISPRRISAGEIVSIESNGALIDYGDGLQGRQANRVYTQEGRYTIRSNDSAVQVVVDQGIDQIAGRIVGGPLVIGLGESVELSVETDRESIDRVIRQRGNQQEEVSSEVSVRIDTVDEEEFIPVSATLLDSDGNEYGVLQTTIANGLYDQAIGSQLQSSALRGSSLEPIEFSTRWTGGGVRDVRYIQWYINAELIDQLYSQDTWEYQFGVPGIYEVTQEIYFKDRTQPLHTNIMMVNIEGDPSPLVSLEVPDSVVVGESFESSLVFEEGSFSDVGNREWYIDGRATGESTPSYVYTAQELGFVGVGGRGEDQYGQTIYLHERVSIIAQDNCLDVGRYVCDMDQDGISDVCDNDIDGDEIENPLGILLQENENCEITNDILNEDVLRESIGRLGVDVCPFVFDPEQLDENNDGIGDACGGLLEGELCYDSVDNDGDGDIDCDDSDCEGLPVCEAQEGSGDDYQESQAETGTDGGGEGEGGGSGGEGEDSDGDGVIDDNDACPGVSGGSGGCPEIPPSPPGGQSTGTNGGTRIVNPGCVTCPCPTLDRRADLRQGDQVRALLYDESGNILYTHTQPYPINP